jgi:hypothetical protein
MHLGVLRTRLLLPLSLTLDDAVRVLYVCCVSVIPSFVVGLRRTHRCASLGPPPLPSLQKHFPLPRSQTSKVSPFPPPLCALVRWTCCVCYHSTPKLGLHTFVCTWGAVYTTTQQLCHCCSPPSCCTYVCAYTRVPHTNTHLQVFLEEPTNFVSAGQLAPLFSLHLSYYPLFFFDYFLCNVELALSGDRPHTRSYTRIHIHTYAPPLLLPLVLLYVLSAHFSFL